MISREDVLKLLPRFLARFELGPLDQFRFILEKAHAIISGSFPLKLLVPFDFTPGDVDLYVPLMGARVMYDFLLAKQYRMVETRRSYNDSDEVDTRGINHMHTFKKDAKSIHLVIVDSDSSPLKAIVNFDSTLVMNFISHFGLVCLYPETTLHATGIRTPHSVSHPNFFLKYISRGYKFADQCSQLPDSCLDETRTLLDGKCAIWFFDYEVPVNVLEPYNLEWRLPGECRHSNRSCVVVREIYQE